MGQESDSQGDDAEEGGGGVGGDDGAEVRGVGVM